MTTAARPAQDTFESVRAPGPITAPSAPASASGRPSRSLESGIPADGADRRRAVEVRDNGSLWDHATYRMWIDQLDRRAPQRARITRLSLSDPESLAIAGELAARSGR